MDVRIDGGTIAELGARLDPNSHRIVEADGLSFWHRPSSTRTCICAWPGRTRRRSRAGRRLRRQAAIARILDAERHRSRRRLPRPCWGPLAETAEAEAEVPVGFLAAISKGLEGDEAPRRWPSSPTPAQRGSATTAGRWPRPGYDAARAPVRRRRRPAAGAALRGADALSRSGQMHEGAVPPSSGSRATSVAEGPDGRARLVARGVRGQASALPAPVGPARVRGCRSGARAAGVRATAEVTPHYLCLTDEAVRSLDSNLKMNPPLRSVDDQAALVGGLRDGTIGAIATDHAPHAPRRTCRSKRRPSGSQGWRPRSPRSTPRRAGSRQAGTAAGSHVGRPGRRCFGLPAPRIAVGEPANLVLLDTKAGWRVQEDGFRFSLVQLMAPRPAPHRKSAPDRRGRQDGVGVVTGFLVLEDGTVFRGESVGAACFAFGEAVFTTAMTGYQEVVTDELRRADRVLRRR